MKKVSYPFTATLTISGTYIVEMDDDSEGDEDHTDTDLDDASNDIEEVLSAYDFDAVDCDNEIRLSLDRVDVDLDATKVKVEQLAEAGK